MNITRVIICHGFPYIYSNMSLTTKKWRATLCPKNGDTGPWPCKEHKKINVIVSLIL